MDAVAALERVVPYADVPIQHITDAMMQRMNRGISGRRVRAVLQRLRERVPGIALRTTVIVGHPGETEADLEALIDFLEEFRFERLGVFPYSREQGTPAGEAADHLPDAVVDERVERVAAVAKRLALEKHSQRLGRTEEVMIDGPPVESGSVPARSSWDAPEIDGMVWVRGVEAPAGAVVPVRITAAGPHDVLAEPVRSTAAHPLGTSVDVVRSPALGSGAGRAEGVRAAGVPAQAEERVQELSG
jgi:ribosomal protein S12 methylthiotransferase